MPLAGFYIWQRTDAGYRQPFYVRLVNRPVFGVAALWDRFVTDDDDVIEGCAIVTVPPNSLLTQIDNTGAQMPAILHRDNYQTWLSGRPAQARELLQFLSAGANAHARGRTARQFSRIRRPELDSPDRINWRVWNLCSGRGLCQCAFTFELRAFRAFS